jgi:hypothetical protein
MISSVSYYLPICQQSSRFTYLYPFAANPDETSRSAVYLITVSLILQPKWFQEFHPIGGVRPSPLSSADPNTSNNSRIITHMLILYQESSEGEIDGGLMPSFNAFFTKCLTTFHPTAIFLFSLH